VTKYANNEHSENWAEANYQFAERYWLSSVSETGGKICKRFA